ncbi:MAG: hypothetical protein JWP02_2197, partial [Acidimicrobiales bacterium]|nr:hypothetical protein [Acidimicrobiales bacterium]
GMAQTRHQHCGGSHQPPPKKPEPMMTPPRPWHHQPAPGGAATPPRPDGCGPWRPARPRRAHIVSPRGGQLLLNVRRNAVSPVRRAERGNGVVVWAVVRDRLGPCPPPDQGLTEAVVVRAAAVTEHDPDLRPPGGGVDRGQLAEFADALRLPTEKLPTAMRSPGRAAQWQNPNMSSTTRLATRPVTSAAGAAARATRWWRRPR